MDLVKSPEVPAHLAAKYEAQAGRFWDLFYRRNQDRFFKDRHYFQAEFPQLLTASRVLEVGCGAGNSVFPLLALNPSATVYACDFAPSAVALVRAHSAYGAAAEAGRVHAFVADINADDLTAHVPPSSMDTVTMVFVLSAISPEAMPRALRSVARTLRPGGQLLFRDYAAGDLAQERLAGEGKQQRLGANFYVRWDGTRAFYFTEDFLRKLFQAEGFRCEYSCTKKWVAENRRRGERMERRFLQAVFTYCGSGSDSSSDRGRGGSGGNSGIDTDERGASNEGSRQQARRARGAAGGGDTMRTAQQLQQEERGLQKVWLGLGDGDAKLQLQLMCQPRSKDGGPAAAAAVADRAAAEAQAALVLRCPAFFHNADVLEICSWDAPLAALGALRWCRRAVAAGGTQANMQLLRRNAQRNGHLVVIERLRLQQLAWRAEVEEGEEGVEQQQQQQQQWWQEQQEQLRRAFPAGFRSILAAVPAGTNAADLRRLLGVVTALLSQQPGALAFMCFADQLDAQQALAAAAAAAQLQEVPAPAEVAAGCSTSPPTILCMQLQ